MLSHNRRASRRRWRRWRSIDEPRPWNPFEVLRLPCCRALESSPGRPSSACHGRAKRSVACRTPVGVLALAALAIPCDAPSRFVPFGVQIPDPAVAGGVADREKAVEGVGAEDVEDVGAPAEVEGVREFVRIDFVEVGAVALLLALSFQGGEVGLEGVLGG